MTDEHTQDQSETTENEIEVQPSFAPPGMALGVTFLFWGIVTHWVISVAGGVMMTWAICTWINELCREGIES